MFEISDSGFLLSWTLPEDVTSLAYKSSYEVEWAPATGTLSIVDTANSNATLVSSKLVGSYAGDAFELSNDGGGGTAVTAVAEPWANVPLGDVLVCNVPGQTYIAYENLFNAGNDVGTNFVYAAAAGQAFTFYSYDYAAGGEFIGWRFFSPGDEQASYAYEEVDYNGAAQATRAAFTGVTGAAYSSYEYDWVGGVFAGSKFTYTTVPAGATYSSYEVDYGSNTAFAGSKFFFTNVTGQTYTGEEVDFDANMALSRVVLTGVQDQAYSSLELDYSAGTYEGFKAFYNVTGQSYTNEEVDVSASGPWEKVVISGFSGTPFQTVEQDYSGGSLADTVYGCTDVTGQTYYAYQLTEDPSGTPLQETFDLNSGGHNLIAWASGQTLTSLGNDNMTGSSTGSTTFRLNAIYGADTIANFTSADTISLPLSEFANFAALTNAAVQSGANVLITAADGDTLTLKNLTTTALAGMASDFTLHA